MKDATQQIQPEDIDTSRHFFDAFDKQEREISARWIVRFCQDRGKGWEPFTYEDIDCFYRSKGLKDGFWMNGLDEYGIIPDDMESRQFLAPKGNPKYIIYHEFVSRCYKSSPMEGEPC